jgi:C4-dicarboxylate transporter DctQ subunit
MISSAVSSAALWLSIVFGAVMALTVFVSVIGRYLLNFSLPWGEELPRFLLIAMVFLGSSTALERGRHVRLHVFLNLLPKKVALVLLIVGDLLVGWFLVVLVRYGIRLIEMEGSFQTMPVMGLPMTWLSIWIVIGAILMLFQLIRVILDNVEALVRREPTHTELDESSHIL